MEELSCGSWGYWDWGSNPVAAAPVFRTYRAFLTRERPVVDVALLFPTTSHRLNPDVGYPARLQEAGTALREVMDFDIVDEQLIAEGALASYRVLIAPEGRWLERTTLARIQAWIRRGGVLVRIGESGLAPVEISGAAETPEAREPQPVAVAKRGFLKHLAACAGATAVPCANRPASGATILATAGGAPVAWSRREGRGRVLVWSSFGKTPAEHRAFYELCRDAVYNLSALDPALKSAVEVKRSWDGAYCTLLANGEVLVLNDKAVAKTVAIGGARLTIPPKSLRSVMLRLAK
jgi:hypothetical protein